MSCSHPERIAALSQQIAAGATLVEESSAAAHRAVTTIISNWRGDGAAAFSEAGTGLVTRIGRDSAALTQIATALTRMAQTLDDAHVLTHQAEDALSVALATAAAGLPADTSQAWALQAQAQDVVTTAVSRAVLDFDGIDLVSGGSVGGGLAGIVQRLEDALAADWLATRRAAGLAPAVGALSPLMSRVSAAAASPPTPGDVAEFDQQRFDDLSRDPDQGGRITENSREEARAALRLERRGELRNVVRAAGGTGADFVEEDGSGKVWDVKSYRDDVGDGHGAYTIEPTESDLVKCIDRDGENIIISTAHLTPEHVAEIQSIVANHNWADRVLYVDGARAPDPIDLLVTSEADLVP